jgi:hypothetical protein
MDGTGKQMCGAQLQTIGVGGTPQHRRRQGEEAPEIFLTNLRLGRLRLFLPITVAQGLQIFVSGPQTTYCVDFVNTLTLFMIFKMKII